MKQTMKSFISLFILFFCLTESFPTISSEELKISLPDLEHPKLIKAISKGSEYTENEYSYM